MSLPTPRSTLPPGAPAAAAAASTARGPGLRRWLRLRPDGTGWIWGAAALLFAAYAALSVRDQQRMLTTGFDLGIFEQAVRSYAHGQLPVSALKGPGFPLLGDHFSPIVAVLAPFYRLWPTPMTLLVAQAALLAVAVVPLARWAQRVAGRGAALVVAFAVPLLAFALTALAERRMRAAALWALPLLLVKEDLGLTVAAVGALIAWYGHRRLGLATAAAGVLGTMLEVLVVIPAFSPGGHYTYWSSMSGSGSGGAPARHGLGELLYRLSVGMVTPDTKVVTLVLLLAPTAFLAVRSPLLWVAFPTLAWRFFSTSPAYWGTGYQYSAVLMPIVFAALVDALGRRPGSARSVRPQLVAAALVTAALLPQYPLFQLAHPATWQTSPRIAAARRILDRIPDGTDVAATNRLVPQLTSRTTVTEFGVPGQPTPADTRWIVVDTATAHDWPFSGGQQRQDIAAAQAQGFRTVVDQDGYLLLHRS